MSSSFTKPLTVTKISPRRWKVAKEFTYYLKEVGKESIVIPIGFTTDFASVPRLFWILFPPDGRYTQAAVLHDFLYFIQTRSRRQSDHIFLQGMKVLRVNWLKRRTLWLAVRIGGIFPWNRHKKRLSK